MDFKKQKQMIKKEKSIVKNKRNTESNRYTKMKMKILQNY